jgi:hypothetical protein
MKTSNKKGENLIQISNKKTFLNISPFTPRKQLHFTNQKAKKYDISCSQKEQDKENLKNNLLLTYLECQNCPTQSQNQILNYSSSKEKPSIIFNNFKNQYSKRYSNELIVSIKYI